MTAALITGAGLTLAVLGFINYAKDKGWNFAWWQWLLLAIGAVIFLYGVAFLGTSIAEGVAGAGFLMFGIAVVLAVIFGAIVNRTLKKA